MTVNSLDKETVELVSSTLWMEEQLDLTLFHITNFTLGPANASDPKQGVKMVTRMRRKVTTEMMTTYFPTILLMAITYATTFFKPIFFEASLTVNLTTMLVMTTIFISKMESLPPTSDIKMIDIWLILCQIYPFLQVVLLTAMEYKRDEDKERRPKVKLSQPSIAVEDNEATGNPNKSRLSMLVHGWTAPTLKTLGRLDIYFDNKPAHFVLKVQNSPFISFSLNK